MEKDEIGIEHNRKKQTKSINWCCGIKKETSQKELIHQNNQSGNNHVTKADLMSKNQNHFWYSFKFIPIQKKKNSIPFWCLKGNEFSHSAIGVSTYSACLKEPERLKDKRTSEAVDETADETEGKNCWRAIALQTWGFSNSSLWDLETVACVESLTLYRCNQNPHLLYCGMFDVSKLI